jgi:glucose uptake protein
MFVLESYVLAVFFLVITMLCWGSWANTQKLVEGKWRFELFYWDYAIGVLLMSAIFALTMGSSGTVGRSFISDVTQAQSMNLFLAFVGGVVFNAANILLVAAIAIAGLAVAFPVAIGIAIVIGVVLNYVATPVGNPFILFLGVAFVVAAIFVDAKAYRSLPTETEGLTAKGLLISIASGILMGFFYRFVAASMSTDFTNLEAGKLGPYSAVFYFAVGLFISNFLFNTLLMKKPFVGEPVPVSAYFKGPAMIHLAGILGGMIWGVGMMFNFIASGQAGFAISYGLGQCGTMVAALWGVFIWREFREAPAGTNKWITLMFVFYMAGILAIILARGD